MSALALDPVYNDLLFTNGRLTLLASNSPEEFAQKLNCRFGFTQGEWFLDTQQGFPWFVILGVKNPNVPAIAQIFTNVIMGTPGAKAVVSLPIAYDPAVRILRWNAQIEHVSGVYVTGGRGTPFIVQPDGAVAT